MQTYSDWCICKRRDRSHPSRWTWCSPQSCPALGTPHTSSLSPSPLSVSSCSCLFVDLACQVFVLCPNTEILLLFTSMKRLLCQNIERFYWCSFSKIAFNTLFGCFYFLECLIVIRRRSQHQRLIFHKEWLAQSKIFCCFFNLSKLNFYEFF